MVGVARFAVVRDGLTNDHSDFFVIMGSEQVN